MNALGFLANVYTGGGVKQALTASGLGKLFSNILETGRNTPNYQFANPNKPGFNRIASDFYDPRTGLDRFDRARTLFGQSRTMKEFLDKLKDKRAAEQAAKDKAILDAEFAAGRGGSGQDFTGGRYDGAPDAATYSAEPTAYSGAVNGKDSTSINKTSTNLQTRCC